HLDIDFSTGGSNCGGGSLRSSDTPDELSLSPGGCPTPSSGDPDSELSYTVGVTENTPYGCQFCDKAFPRLSYLKRHEQIHSDQMPFRCDYCQRLFKHKRSRDRHVKLHTGDRKYRCSQCESAFSRSDHLKIHMKTHDNGKPYQCTVCNRGYNTAAALSSHMQNHKKSEANMADNQGNVSMVHTQSLSTNSVGENQVDKEGRENDTPDPPKPLLCHFCPQVCSSPTALGDHVLQSHRSFSSSSPLSDSPRSSRCYKCVEELSSPNAVCPHRKLFSENDTEKSCLENNNSGGKITERFSPSMKLTCGFCSKSDFPSFESLQLHVQVLHVPTGGSESSLATSIRSLQSLLHKQPQNSQNDPFLGYPGIDSESGFTALHMLQKHASLSEGLMLKRPNDIYCSQCNIGFTSSAALLDHVQLVHENTSGVVPRPPSSPLSNHSTKRSLTSSRLRPNGAKHFKASPGMGAPVFNGSTSSHYRRQDPGGGSANHNTGPNTPSGANTLLCSQCNAGFPDFESFRTHLKSHLDAAAAGKNPAHSTGTPSNSVPHSFSCSECSAEFDNEPLLDAHVAGHFLSSTTEYGCQSCLKLFAKPDELQKHLMDVHAYHLYRCALCKQIFDSKVSIQVHFAVKHSNECRSLKCTSCSAYFRTEIEFQVHVKLAHLSNKTFGTSSGGTSYRCLLCDQLFPNEVQLRYHASTHKKQYSCSACGEAFHVEFLLDRHIQTVHQGSVVTSSPPLHHPFIGLRNNSPISPPSNLSQQTPEEAQNLCTKKPTNGNRGDCMHGHHSVDSSAAPTTATSPPVTTSPSGHRCDICDVTCPSESSLMTHRRQVHHIRTHKDQQHSSKSGNGSSGLSLFCAYCNESCKSRAELENHMKAHTATPSKHKCNICDEMCPSATTLAEHKLTHCKVISGSTCIVCRVQLSNEDQFLSHIQQHSTSAPNGKGNGLPVPCVVCRQTLVVDVEVRMHARFHLKNASFEPTLGTPAPCCVCSRMFDPGNLIIRSSGKASDSLPPHTYMCKDCFHSKGDADTGVPRCSDCNVKFESFGDLDVHRRTVHYQRNDKKTYQCIKCQMSFESETDIQAHVTCHVLNEGTHHECRLCHEVLDSPSKLQCHLIEHTFEGSSHYTCYLCASVFTGPHLLQRHMLDHGLEARPYDCPECQQKFFFRAELENHSFVHVWENVNRLSSSNAVTKGTGNGERSSLLYECSKCPCVFGNAIDLGKHQRSHGHDVTIKQESIDRMSNVCPTCGMEFNSKDDLRGHMMLIHSSTPLREAFASDIKPGMARHDLYNFEEEKQPEENSSKGVREKKSFECPVCKKQFTRKENRKLHMKTHHQNPGPKTFSCSHCDKVFLKRSQVKDHMRTHITSTTHPCEICDESFPSTSLLRRHLKDVHKRKYEHTCIVCSELFDTNDQLDAHLNEEHQVRVQERLADDSLKNKSDSPPPSPEPSAAESTNQDTALTSEIPRDSSLELGRREERTSMPTEVAA
ncbi:zinc finger protein 423-like, partial [Uloborus diversus]|uniref:zinc finger protein 423-like n=1 Tax=Uloborus diversus TaxID=327109 RepID=UPI002409180F